MLPDVLGYSGAASQNFELQWQKMTTVQRLKNSGLDYHQARLDIKYNDHIEH